MTLTQQVEAALADEVLATAWERLHPEAMRELVLSALAPVLAQQEAMVTTLTAERDRARHVAHALDKRMASLWTDLHGYEREIASWPTK